MAVSFTGAHFPPDIILMGGRWYVAYPLSTRHVEELMGFPQFWSKKQRSVVSICIDIPYMPNTQILPADLATRPLV